MSKKKEFPPLSPLAEKIKKILDQKLKAPRYDIVTGKTKAAIEIEKIIIEKIKKSKIVSPGVLEIKW